MQSLRPLESIMRKENDLKKFVIKYVKKHLKEIVPVVLTTSIFLILYGLHNTGFETTITKILTPIFNMVSFVFSQPFLTLPLKWIPLALAIFIMGFVALALILWPYILVGISFMALIAKTLWNKTKERKRVVKIIWILFFVYIFTLWFAMANNTANWLPGKSQTEYVLYEKCNPWAEKYTPDAAKKVAGLQVIKYVETEYGLAITLDAARKQNNLWSAVKVVWGGAKIFFMKGLL